MISFIVYGQPRPQGSKVSHAIYNKQGQPVIKNGRVLVVTRDDCKDLQSWRNQVSDKAATAFNASRESRRPDDERGLIAGPVYLQLRFVRARPKSHYGTGKNAQRLKPSAPTYPTTKPDLLKLARGVEDSLTGVVLVDDKQVRRHLLSEVYGRRYETHVAIMEL